MLNAKVHELGPLVSALFLVALEACSDLNHIVYGDGRSIRPNEFGLRRDDFQRNRTIVLLDRVCGLLERLALETVALPVICDFLEEVLLLVDHHIDKTINFDGRLLIHQAGVGGLHRQGRSAGRMRSRWLFQIAQLGQRIIRFRWFGPSSLFLLDVGSLLFEVLLYRLSSLLVSFPNELFRLFVFLNHLCVARLVRSEFVRLLSLLFLYLCVAGLPMKRWGLFGNGSRFSLVAASG